MSNKTPCRGCTERHLYCHDTCEGYKAYRSRIDANKRERTVMDEYARERKAQRAKGGKK